MLFLEDNNSFSFSATPLKSIKELEEGLWLLLIGINDVPPHIALAYEGKYYSLTARKLDNGSPLVRLIDTLQRKKIPTLFVHIETNNNILSFLENLYKDLPPLGNTDKTCLSPIKELFATTYSEEFSKSNYIFELLALAQTKGLLKECLSVFCAPNDVTLPKYTMAQIKNRIQELSQPKALQNH